MSNAEQESSAEQRTTVGSLLSEIVWLQAQSARHRYTFFIGDLEWAVFPAVANGQVQVFRADKRPFGAALWAFVSDEVDKRLAAGAGKLKPEEWRSGRHVWIIDLIAPWGHGDRILEELRKGPLAAHTFKCQYVSPEGKRDILTINGDQVATPEKTSGTQKTNGTRKKNKKNATH